MGHRPCEDKKARNRAAAVVNAQHINTSEDALAASDLRTGGRVDRIAFDVEPMPRQLDKPRHPQDPAGKSFDRESSRLLSHEVEIARPNTEPRKASVSPSYKAHGEVWPASTLHSSFAAPWANPMFPF